MTRSSDRAIAQAFWEWRARSAAWRAKFPASIWVEERAREIEASAPCADCCDTPSFCSSVRRCTARDAAAPDGAQAVAWQCRARDPDEAMGNSWFQCAQSQFERRQLQDRYEYPALYTAPPSLGGEDAANEGYYLASFKQPWRGGPLLWWRPDNAGYTTDLQQAGIYTELTPGYHDSGYTVPVPVSFVRGLRIRHEVDPGDSENEALWTAAKLRAAIDAARAAEGGERG